MRFIWDGRLWPVQSGADGDARRVEYEVGFGPLGAPANSLFISRQTHKIFAHRQKVLPKLLKPPV